MSRGAQTGQDSASAAKNASFFEDNERYAQRVAQLQTYRNIRAAVNAQIGGSQKLLDVGNGGVFDYDTSLADAIVGVDLFLDGTPANLPANVTLRHGDALRLAEPDATYDRVLEISVFHHLVGRDAESTLANIRQAVSEAHRVLAPGGRFVVMESCVSPAAFAIERRLFRPLELLARTPLLSHPAVLQFPTTTIAGVIEETFGEVAVSPIPVGRWIIQLGFRWPVRLTPARPWLFTATRHG